MMPQTETSQFYSSISRSPASPRRNSNATRARRSVALLYSAARATRRRAARRVRRGRRARHGSARRAAFCAPHADPERLPAWLTEADIDFYAGEFSRTGFRGGLNWYRNIDRNCALMAPFDGLKVTVPALYVAGDRDLVVGFAGMTK